LIGASRIHWDVDQLTRKVYIRSLTSFLNPTEAEQLRNEFSSVGSGSTHQSPLSSDGQAIYPLLTKLDAHEAESALQRLPLKIQKQLDSISPVRYVNDIQAPLIVLCHDRDDPVIPLEESQRLAAALSNRAGVRYTEFTMFKHLDPSKVKLALVPMVRELMKFYFAMYPIFRQAVTA
jgi:hypothetical protein